MASNKMQPNHQASIMSKWKKLKGIDLSVLRDNRKSLHHAVQLVGAVPRNLLPHDPTDGTASLQWNTSLNSLESIPVTNPVGLQIAVGFRFKTFFLYMSSTGTQIDWFDMKGKSANEGLYWIKEKLEKLLFPFEEISFNLPYKIENFNTIRPLGASEQALKEYAKLYRNSHRTLAKMAPKWENAYDVRCWPHHFDLATLVPIKTDKDGEILESIGIGFSPGDEGIDEPYLYVNVWPKIEADLLSKHDLQIGQWNSEAWCGAVLTYSELLQASDQQTSFVGFIESATQAINIELK